MFIRIPIEKNSEELINIQLMNDDIKTVAIFITYFNSSEKVKTLLKYKGSKIVFEKDGNINNIEPNIFGNSHFNEVFSKSVNEVKVSFHDVRYGGLFWSWTDEIWKNIVITVHKDNRVGVLDDILKTIIHWETDALSYDGEPPILITKEWLDVFEGVNYNRFNNLMDTVFKYSSYKTNPFLSNINLLELKNKKLKKEFEDSLSNNIITKETNI